TSPLPNAESASERASWKERPKSSGSVATRIPFPPPPAAALMMTGKPMSRANFSASSGSSTPPGVPGMIGTPTSCIVFRAAALSPMVRICDGVGPMNAMFDAMQVSANSAFSARNPYPGWIASAPAISAAAMMRGILRYDSRAGAGPMQTSSSANRTCSDSRSASEYTATVWMPSSRQARMTRSAISPRLAIKTFLNIAPLRGRLAAFEVRPARVARAGNTLHAQCKLAGARGVEHGALVRDHALRVPHHQGLVEALHAVL